MTKDELNEIRARVDATKPTKDICGMEWAWESYHNGDEHISVCHRKRGHLGKHASYDTDSATACRNLEPIAIRYLSKLLDEVDRLQKIAARTLSEEVEALEAENAELRYIMEGLRK